jgi:dipeptide transport system permease protein
MLEFLGRKVGILVPTFLGISLVAFSLIRLVPGDPVLLMLGERGASPQVYAEMRSKLSLDQPLTTQYFTFLKNAVRGDLGESVVSKRAVTEEFWSRFPATLELGLVAMTLSILVGIPLGILAATRRNSWLDYTVMGTSLIGYSMPIFWWGLILILIFSVRLGWTPVSGRIAVEFFVPESTGFMLWDTLRVSEAEGGGWPAFWSALRHIALPSIALGTIPLATIARMTRSSMLEVIGEDYIRTAKAKGLSRGKIIWVHALKNALVPIVTVIGLIFGALITGAILTETIFSWPGIGKWLVKSVVARDYPVIQGGILIIAGMIVFINMSMDLIYAWVNPRIRDART